MVDMRIAGRAQDDLRSIITYLDEKAGSEVAARYVSLFAQQLRRLAAIRELRTPRPALGQDLRSISVPPYIVFHAYRTGQTILRVLQVLLERRHVTQPIIRGR